MPGSQKLSWFGDWLWLLAWAIASSVWCVTAARELGPTFDEPFYVQAGLNSWRTGSHKFVTGMGTMPLPVEVNAFPLYVWERWQGIRLDETRELDKILPWARAGNLVFWWLLLFYGRKVGRTLAGPWGGRLAVAWLACEPNLLAHASLATTDIAFSACLLALIYHFRAGRDGPWLRRVGLTAFWFGVALTAKASALVFAPLCLVVVELERLFVCWRCHSPGTPHSQVESQIWRRRVLSPLVSSGLDLAQIVGLGLAFLFLLCTDAHHPTRPLAPGTGGIPQGAIGHVVVWAGEHARSLENAYKALTFQIRHNWESHGWTYLLGELHSESVWYYFPMVLCIKLTLPLLAMPLVLGLFRFRALANWAFLAALTLLVWSPAYRVQLGIRMILPLVVLGVVGLAVAAARAWHDSRSRWRKGMLAGWLGASLAGMLWATTAWPHGLGYTNELWGGSTQGYRYLTDSNYDWGQGLKELARWQEQHRASSLDVWYFGTDQAIEKPSFHRVSPGGMPLAGPNGLLAQLHGHYLAASTTHLYGWSANTAAARFLRKCKPVARTSTFFIYDFTLPEGP